ncbi:MAG: 3-phosphoshikimate 1-carboxyvinyltransferase [Ruminococcaceae bacterium]|nr:3-phosphoshikimate 1-carboxyvinyltransferase [Oscillospiraceae bacterium]
MKAVIRPSKAYGSVKIPPSKSMAHRAIICAALADGESVVSNIDYSVDISTTIDCMRKLGAEIECSETEVKIRGIKDFDGIKDTHIECNESGSTLRFLIPLFSLTGRKITFTGKNRLLKRPQKIYEEIFAGAGLLFEQTEEKIEIQGALPAKKYTLSGGVSSQFISGLLFTLPLLKEDSTINILPPFESRSYIDLTIQMMAKFGVEIMWQDELTLYIRGGQKYIAHNETVEGDFSQFAFFGVLSAVNSPVEIYGMNPESLQGDKQILQILSDFGCNVNYKDGIYKVCAENGLKAADIDLKNCPDLGPVLCTLAMFSKGTTHIDNANRLRIKESDRILAMQSECAKMDCKIEATENEMFINGGYSVPLQPLDGWKDHRIVMACAVALSVLGGEINGCEAVSKSYPSFFEDLEKVGIEVEFYD